MDLLEIRQFGWHSYKFYISESQLKELLCFPPYLNRPWNKTLIYYLHTLVIVQKTHQTNTNIPRKFVQLAVRLVANPFDRSSRQLSLS